MPWIQQPESKYAPRFCCFASFDPLFEIECSKKLNRTRIPAAHLKCMTCAKTCKSLPQRHLDEFIKTPQLKMKNKRVTFNELLNCSFNLEPMFCCLSVANSISVTVYKTCFCSSCQNIKWLNHCQDWFTNPFFFFLVFCASG